MTEKKPRNPVDEILSKFGKRPALAEALQKYDGRPCNRHQIGKWAHNGAIPNWRLPSLLAVAASFGVSLTAEELVEALDVTSWPVGATGRGLPTSKPKKETAKCSTP